MKIIKQDNGWHQLECSMVYGELDLWQDDDFICLSRKQVRELYRFLKSKIQKDREVKRKRK